MPWGRERIAEKVQLPFRTGLKVIHRFAFSLLELLIVLAVMVGIVAVAFPRLTRPLAESEVQRAASGLRDTIVDCRQAAAFFGQPVVLRLQAGGDQIVWGDWAEVIGEDWGLVGDTDGGDTTASALSTSTSSSGSVGNPIAFDGRPRRSTLPFGMVVEAVHWVTRGGPGDELPDSVLMGDAAGGIPGDAAGGGFGNESGERWYVAFLPSGRSRDCVIVVLDRATGMRAGLEIDAVTGLSRITRLPAATATATATAAATATALTQATET